MKFNEMLPFRTALIGLSIITLPQWTTAQDNLSNAYCSTENTGSGSGPTYNRYQSMGACSTTCKSQYAFAILQGSNCWCSNYIPADQSSTSDCDSTCPGYPSDLCGNPSKGMFGYIALQKAPSGTAGASQSQNTAGTSPSAYTQAPTSYTAPSSTSPSAYSSVPPSSAPPTTSSTPPSSTDPPTAVVHTKVVTLSGSVVTQTVTTTPVVISGGDSPATAQMDRHTLSGGAIAGIVIGTLLGLAALILAAFLLWRRKNDSDAEDQGATRPRRTTSVLSRTGLLARGRSQSMAENPFDNSHQTTSDPYFASSGAAGGTTSTRHSMLFGAGAMGAGITIEPSSPLGASRDDLGSGSGSGSRRHSRPLVYDQRLNPSALFANPDANGSRVSMQDQQDYSRPLGVANPDMRGSFDSR